MTTTTTFVASKACPCIDLWNDVKYTNFTFTQGICPDGHYSAYKAGSYNMICIPIEYGQNTCSAYDSGSSPFSDDCALPVDDRLYWCNDIWCYVDPSNCERPHSPTDFSLEPYGDALPIAYSYDTCGNVDQYSATLTLQSIENRHLRLTYPDDSSDGFNLLSTKDSTGYIEYTGASVQMQRLIFDKYNITYTVQHVTEKSKAELPDSSSYTQCVHDIMLNETDICIGPFTITPQRLRWTVFTIPFAEDTHKSLFQYLTTSLKPFTSKVWFMLLVVVMYMTAALMIVQRKYTNRQWKNKSLKKKFQVSLGWMSNNIYYGSKAFSSGGVSNESDNPETAEKFIVVGFSFFAIIVLTAYTATSAAALVLNEAEAEFKSMDEVINRRPDVCVTEIYEETIKGLYPSIEDKVNVYTNSYEIFDAMDNDECSVGFVTEDIFYKRISKFEEDCEYKMLVQKIFTASLAYPLKFEIKNAFNYAMGDLKGRGTIDTLQNSYRTMLIDVPACDRSAENSHWNYFVQLGPRELIAPLMITFFCTTAGLITFIINNETSKKKSKVKHDKSTMSGFSDSRSNLVGASQVDVTETLTEIQNMLTLILEASKLDDSSINSITCVEAINDSEVGKVETHSNSDREYDLQNRNRIDPEV